MEPDIIPKPNDGIFWMLYAEGRSTPATKHPSLEIAISEAERICKKDHVKVYILQVVKSVEVSSPPVTIATYKQGTPPEKEIIY